MNIESEFFSDDILLVSFILTQGINLLRIIQDYNGHFIFVLSNLTRCTELKQQYLNNAPASARQLFSQREMLISEIKNRDRDGNAYGKSE